MKLLFILIFILISNIYSSDISLLKDEQKYLDTKKTITMCIDPNWMPFERFNDNNKYEGMSADYFQIFSKKLNVEFKVIYSKTWIESLEYAKSRKCDILSLAMKTPQRSKYLNFTTPYLSIPLVITTNLDVQFINSIEELKNKKIAMTKGYAYIEILKEKYPFLDILEVTDIDEGLEKVQEKEVYAYIGTIASVGYKIQAHYVSELKISGKFEETWDLGIAVRDDDITLLNILEKAINSISYKEKKEILDKWLSVKYNQRVDDETILIVLGIFFIIIFILIYIYKREKELNRLLHSQSKKLQKGQEIAKLGYWSFNLKTNELEWGENIYKIFEIDKNSISPSYDLFLDLVHPEDREKVNQEYQQSLKNKTPYEVVHRLVFKDGRTKWILEQCHTEYDKNGDPLISFGIIQDITEKYLADTKYKLLLDSATDGIHVLDKKGNLLEFSDSFAQSLGYSNDEMTRLNVVDWVISSSKDGPLSVIANLMQNPRTFETRFIKKDGTIMDVQITAKGIYYNGEKYLYASSRDITDIKNYQHTIEHEKEKFEAIFNYAQDAIAIIDKNTNFIECNQAMLDLFGYSKNELKHTNCNNLTIKDDQEKNLNAVKEVLVNHKNQTFEKTCVGYNGKRIEVSESISLLPNNEHLLIILKDITESKYYEKQSKLIAMGKMIENIAHQWRQPLSIMSTAASAIELDLEFNQNIDKSKIIDLSRNIIYQTQYLSETINVFRNFIKEDKYYKLCSIKETLEKLINLTSYSLEQNNIELVVSIEDDIEIYMNKNELVEALLNIINNAQDFLNLKVQEGKKFISIETKKLSEDKLELRICDNAGGIPDTVKDSIFEPYFTTKHQSIGTGLGLSITHKIITERHNQTIKVHNETLTFEDETYQGACFIVVFTKQNH